MTTDDERQTIAEIAEVVFERFGVEPHKDLDQSKVRSMISEACALTAEIVMREKVQVLSLRPGDVLVVHLTDMPRDAAYLDRIGAAWADVAKKFDASTVACTGVERFSILRHGSETNGELQRD